MFLHFILLFSLNIGSFIPRGIKMQFLEIPSKHLVLKNLDFLWGNIVQIFSMKKITTIVCYSGECLNKSDIYFISLKRLEMKNYLMKYSLRLTKK